MLHRAAQLWRVARSTAAKGGRNLSRNFSEGPAAEGGPKTSAGASSSSTADANSRLFENVQPIPEVEAASSAAPPTAASRLFNALSNGLFYSFLGGAAFVGYYQYSYEAEQLQRIVDETEQKPENAFPGSSLWVKAMNWYLEQRRYLEDRVKEFAEPPSDKLLPDLPPQLRHLKTLVLDLDDVLIHADWTRERGWRSFKRPGVEEFLRNMSQYYEVVVYTDQQTTYADPILERIDPNKHIMYRLYRNSTYYVDGKHVRDLSKLNRDLSKVLFISCKPEAFALQPENTIKLPPWKLEKEDTKLLDLMPFLEAVVRTNVTDVRDVVKSYDGADIPTAFKERMQRVQESQRKKQAHGGFLGSFVRH